MRSHNCWWHGRPVLSVIRYSSYRDRLGYTRRAATCRVIVSGQIITADIPADELVLR